MAGIYVHIPFCRSKCAYCNFFSVATKRHVDEVLSSIVKELSLQRRFLRGEKVETIYFGGGTPSIVAAERLFTILDAVYDNFPVADDAEITIEINPDDASMDYLSALSSRFNRLSIGIQSFVEEDLLLLGRKHNAEHAREAVLNARKAGFTNINIDLIYALSKSRNFLPQRFTKKLLRRSHNWRKTLSMALALAPEHISAYALTVEENTILHRKIEQEHLSMISDNNLENQYNILIKKLSEAGYDHYEISNFSKAGYASKHNSAYWNGTPYLGVGPSAHSFNGDLRQWNVAKIADYCQAIEQSKIPATSEVLSETDKYNEFVMLQLRQKSGVVLSELNRRFGQAMSDYFTNKIATYVSSGNVINDGDRFYLPETSFLISDYIISDLF
ncbi:MAG: radical SAM family heme chaperone HemW [Bacteroidales bacterium]|nr:radical SAM family heme chaperone HemW [Bacteroidales bacterium]